MSWQTSGSLSRTLPPQIPWVELPAPLQLPLQTMPLKGQKLALYLKFHLQTLPVTSPVRPSTPAIVITSPGALLSQNTDPYWPDQAVPPPWLLLLICWSITSHSHYRLLASRSNLVLLEDCLLFPFARVNFAKSRQTMKSEKYQTVSVFWSKNIFKNTLFLKLACGKWQRDQVNKKTESLKQQQVSACEMEMDAARKHKQSTV